MLRVGFVGAGPRATDAHYPCVHRLDGVQVEAAAELDEGRRRAVLEQYGIPRSFRTHREMLDAVELDLVYVVMHETLVTPVALDCLNAGRHIFIEKPPGCNSGETQQLLDAAEANRVVCAVGYQRRHAAVTQEALRRVLERGPATLVVGEFHKNFFNQRPEATSTLWNDVCHVVDLVRYLAGGEASEVVAYQDIFESERFPNVYGNRNCYTGMIRFSNRAVGMVMGNRSSGGRVIRAELHGLGIGCYLQLPQQVEIIEDNGAPQVLTGAELAGCDPADVNRYEGVLSMHEHLVDSLLTGQTPSTDIRDVIRTSRLVDMLEGVGQA